MTPAFQPGQKARVTKRCGQIHTLRALEPGDIVTIDRMYRVQDGVEIYGVSIGWRIFACSGDAMEPL